MTGPKIGRPVGPTGPQARPIVLPHINLCARILPPDAVRMLRQAVSTDPGVPAGFSLERTIALNKAIQRIQLQYPLRFNHN